MRILLCWSMLAVFFLASGAGLAQETGEAEDTAFKISPVLSMGLTGGGDTIARYRVEFFGEETDADVDAGDVFFFYGGAKLFWPNSNLGLTIQGGLFGGGVGNYDERADFTRWPVEIIGTYETERWRLGAGVTRHFSPTFEEEGVGDNKLEFDDADGTLFQLEYKINNVAIGLRHVQIDYEIGVAKLAGDHWGVFGTVTF